MKVFSSLLIKAKITGKTSDMRGKKEKRKKKRKGERALIKVGVVFPCNSYTLLKWIRVNIEESGIELRYL